MQTKHLFHKHGGRITAVTHVGHEMDGKCAIWFYIGDVTWDDNGKQSSAVQIPPWAMCYDSDNRDAGMQEINTLSAKLNDYLGTSGKWHQPKAIKGDGRYTSWTPRAKSGRAPVDGVAQAA